MNSSSKQPGEPIAIAPTRLCETDQRAGRLLREVMEQELSARDESLAIAVHREAAIRRARQGRGLLLGAAAVAAAVVALVFFRESQVELEGYEVAAESISSSRRTTAAVSPEANAQSVSSSTADASAEELPQQPSVKTRAPGSEEGSTSTRGAPKLSASVANEGNAAPTSQQCAELARGDHQAGLDCYRAAASGSGVSSEFALLEVARLHNRALANPGAALGALDEYARRYPRGSLRREAALARLDLLLTMGEREKAYEATLRLTKEVPEQWERLTRTAVELAVQLRRCDSAQSHLNELGVQEESLLSLVRSCR